MFQDMKQINVNGNGLCVSSIIVDYSLECAVGLVTLDAVLQCRTND